MKPLVLILKLIRKIYRIIIENKLKIDQKVFGKKNDFFQSQLHEKEIELFDQDANDYIREKLLAGTPCMISKFGAIELSALEQFKSIHQKKYFLTEYIDFIKGKRTTLWWNEGVGALCSNAGFFPNNPDLLERYYNVNLLSMKQIDILGSYLYQENVFLDELRLAKKVNLDGYYAPFLYKEPWTIVLKGKKVLVVHPFAKSIELQYKKRKFLWEDKGVLPEFELITMKAVQSMLGQHCEYENWFDALDAMKKQMTTIDFDIALVGCGAYGMPLAAYAKELGKQAIHLAGWTQVLFGITGKRWDDLPAVAKFMNEYWAHPLPEEIPQNFKKVENGCYW